jgi:hypothetical protein
MLGVALALASSVACGVSDFLGVALIGVALIAGA